MAAAETRKIELRIAAKDEASPVIGNVRQSVDQLSRTIERTGGSSFLGELSALTGARGRLKGIAELFVGGGAIAGISFAASKIGDAAEKAAELARQFAIGHLSAQQLTADLVRALPVLGQFTQMWDRLIASADTIFFPSRSRRQDLESQSREAAEARQSIAAARDRERQRVMQRVQQAEQQMRDAQILSGRTPWEQEIGRLTMENERVYREAAALESQIGRLSPDEQQRLRQVTAAMRRQADEKFQRDYDELVSRTVRQQSLVEQRLRQRRRDQLEEIAQQRVRDADAMERMWEGIMEDRQQRFRRAADQAMRRLAPGFSDPGLPGAIDQRFGSASIFAAREQQAALIAALNDHREQLLRKLDELGQKLDKIVDVESAVEDLFKP